MPKAQNEATNQSGVGVLHRTGQASIQTTANLILEPLASQYLPQQYLNLVAHAPVVRVVIW